MKRNKPLHKPGVTRREFFTNAGAGLVAAELAGASKATGEPAWAGAPLFLTAEDVGGSSWKSFELIYYDPRSQTKQPESLQR